MQMKAGVLLFLVSLTAACSNAAQPTSKTFNLRGSDAPQGITVPSPAPRAVNLVSASWSAARGSRWTHVRAANGNKVAEFYVHQGQVYELRGATSVAYERAFHYLVTSAPETARIVLRHVDSPNTTMIRSAPDSGLAVVHTNIRKPSSLLDFTYDRGGTVYVLTDTSGPKLVDIYEHDCFACTFESSALVATAQRVHRAGGQTFMISSDGLPLLERDLARWNGGTLIIPVQDYRLSIFSVVGVHTLPLNYFIQRNNRIADAESGSLLPNWIEHDLKAVAVR